MREGQRERERERVECVDYERERERVWIMSRFGIWDLRSSLLGFWGRVSAWWFNVF
jgi:hypothetical protein